MKKQLGSFKSMWIKVLHKLNNLKNKPSLIVLIGFIIYFIVVNLGVAFSVLSDITPGKQTGWVIITEGLAYSILFGLPTIIIFTIIFFSIKTLKKSKAVTFFIVLLILNFTVVPIFIDYISFPIAVDVQNSRLNTQAYKDKIGKKDKAKCDRLFNNFKEQYTTLLYEFSSEEYDVKLYLNNGATGILMYERERKPFHNGYLDNYSAGTMGYSKDYTEWLLSEDKKSKYTYITKTVNVGNVSKMIIVTSRVQSDNINHMYLVLDDGTYECFNYSFHLSAIKDFSKLNAVIEEQSMG